MNKFYWVRTRNGTLTMKDWIGWDGKDYLFEDLDGNVQRVEREMMLSFHYGEEEG